MARRAVESDHGELFREIGCQAACGVGELKIREIRTRNFENLKLIKVERAGRCDRYDNGLR